MQSLDAITICSKNYIAQARVLCKSFHSHNAGGRFYLLLVDKKSRYIHNDKEPFDDIYELNQLQEYIPEFIRFVFKYSLLELSTAVKPFFINYLLDNSISEKVAYFDPDILITNELSQISRELETYNILLTPHITSPFPVDGHKPSEVDILRSGIYNLGFIGLRNCKETKKMLEWWSSRLESGCLMEVDEGYHVDQKWIDLVPEYFSGVRILNAPGYNVAYWNLHERSISTNDNEILCNGSPLYFFHFSGYDPDRPNKISKHQTRFTVRDIGQSVILFKQYSKLLVNNGYNVAKKWGNAYALFDNGVYISAVIRKIFRDIDGLQLRFPDPFNTQGNDSYYNWLITPNGEYNSVPPLFSEIWRSRSDLLKAFPDVSGRDREAFIRWMLADGVGQCGLDARLVREAAARALGSGSLDSNSARIQKFRSYLRRHAKNAYHRLAKYPGFRQVLGLLKQATGSHKTLPSMVRRHGARRSVLASAAGDDVGVNLSGYIRSETGMGQAVRCDASCLAAANVPFVVNEVTDYGSSNLEDTIGYRISAHNPFGVNLIHVNADQIEHFVSKRGEGYFAGRYNIGFWAWELSSFPKEWRTAFRYVQEVWTPSKFTLDAVSRAAPVPVIRIPHAIEIPSLQGVDISPLLRELCVGQEQFVFLFIFDFHSYVARKNPEGIIDAFMKAFNGQENVLLLIKTSHAKDHLDEFETLVRKANGHKVRVFDRNMSKIEVLKLIERCDCYVSLHRSEGFGLTLAEAMAIGKPVIATSYSGNMDFMTTNNSFLVKYELIDIEKDYGPYKMGESWAEPNIEDASRYMRYVYENRDSAAAVGRVARVDINRMLSPSEVGKLYKGRLEYIADNLKKGTYLPGSSVNVETHNSLNFDSTCAAIARRIGDIKANANYNAASVGIGSGTFPLGQIIKIYKRAARKSTVWLYNPVFARISSSVKEMADVISDIASLVNNRARIGEESIQRISSEVGILSAQLEAVSGIANDAVSKARIGEESIQRISSEVGMLSAHLDALNRMVNEAMPFVNRIRGEYYPLVYVNRNASVSPTQRDKIDYYGFEAIFRGTPEMIKKRMDVYEDLFLKCDVVVDVGCGRGEFMEYMRESGVRCKGVDVDPSMVDICKSKGLEAICMDFEEYLASLSEGSVDGIFSSQFVEHLPVERLDRFFKIAFRVLRRNGVFVAETINPYNMPSLRFFWVDPSHVRPIYPEVAEFFCRSAGFRETCVRYVRCFGEDRESLVEPWEFCDYAVISRKL